MHQRLHSIHSHSRTTTHLEEVRANAVTEDQMRQWYQEMILDSYKKYDIKFPFQIINADEAAQVASVTVKNALKMGFDLKAIITSLKLKRMSDLVGYYHRKQIQGSTSRSCHSSAYVEKFVPVTFLDKMLRISE